MVANLAQRHIATCATAELNFLSMTVIESAIVIHTQFDNQSLHGGANPAAKPIEIHQERPIKGIAFSGDGMDEDILLTPGGNSLLQPDNKPVCRSESGTSSWVGSGTQAWTELVMQ